MNKKTGIQINSTGDLNILPLRDASNMLTGMTVGDTLYQNQFVILKAHKGELKENPLMGVGIDDMTNDEDILSWKKSIREEFAKDGLKVSLLTITTDAMTLTADY